MAESPLGQRGGSAHRTVFSSRRPRDDGGFTLIELLTVIVIMGVLGGIAVVSVRNFRTRSIASACKTDFRSIELAMETYNTKTGSYPSDTQLGKTSPAQNVTVLKTFPTSSSYSFSTSVVGGNAQISVYNAAGVLKGTTTGACDSV